MIRIDIKKRFEKLVVFLFKIKYIGLYFWSSPSTAKEKSIHLVIGDLLTIFVFLLTIVVVFLIKLGIIPSDISVKEISNARIIALSILGAFALLIAKLITNKIIKIIEKTEFEAVFNLTKFTKKSAFPYFLYVIFDPLLCLIFLVIYLKAINYFLF